MASTDRCVFSAAGAPPCGAVLRRCCFAEWIMAGTVRFPPVWCALSPPGRTRRARDLQVRRKNSKVHSSAGVAACRVPCRDENADAPVADAVRVPFHSREELQDKFRR